MRSNRRIVAFGEFIADRVSEDTVGGEFNNDRGVQNNHHSSGSSRRTLAAVRLPEIALPPACAPTIPASSVAQAHVKTDIEIRRRIGFA
jgi:hypothetical protein